MDKLKFQFLTLMALALMVGCAGREHVPEEPPRPTLYEWHPEGLTGKPRVTIDLKRQIASVTIGGQPAGWCYVATGKEGHGTPAGSYKITEKVVDKRSTLYGIIVDGEGNTVNGDADTRKHKPPPGGQFVLAPMPYWMRLTNYGIGMHAGHIPQPGEPASHGCIRLPEDFAPLLFGMVSIGTPVKVIR